MIVACGQMEATTMEKARDVWPMADRLAAQAGRKGADLLVLPECTYPAYWLESAERYMRPDIERSAAVLARFSSCAADNRLWLVAGFVEEADGRLYNSAAVFDREGRQVGICRKNFMWDCDNYWFSPGAAMSVVDSEFGRMGVLICADARTPEITATLVTQGAEFIVEPTAWVNADRTGRQYLNVQADFMIRARAMEFGVPFACASKSGREEDKLHYVGQSQIVDAAGHTLAKAPIHGEQLILAEIAPAPGRAPLLEPELRQRLLGDRPAARPTTSVEKAALRLRADFDSIASNLKAAGVRVATFSAAQLAAFAPARVAALDGAQVLLYRGRIGDDALLRTRAAENRVFAVVAADAVQQVVAPDGAVVWRQSDGGESLELTPTLADDKRFTPDTDLWEQRRASCFRLPEARRAEPITR